MAKIEPRNFHRLALAVHDVPAAAAWLERILGAVGMVGSPTTRASTQPADADANAGGLAGVETQIRWVGGYPVILLSGGSVGRFLERHGPGAQSFAWEVDDNWLAEHVVRDQGIDVISVNLPGRFFFMQPRQTHGLLLEWCDGKMPRDPAWTEPGAGLVGRASLAWVTGVVADADAVAAWFEGFVETWVVEGNPAGPAEVERTVDLQVGDVVLRLVTPLTAESRYADFLATGPRVHSFAMRVDDLDAALATLEGDGITTAYRHGDLAGTDPATTLGLRIDWTS